MFSVYSLYFYTQIDAIIARSFRHHGEICCVKHRQNFSTGSQRYGKVRHAFCGTRLQAAIVVTTVTVPILFYFMKRTTGKNKKHVERILKFINYTNFCT
jgi:hypothetical protein